MISEGKLGRAVSPNGDRKNESIDLASLLLTDQHPSQNISDCDPTERERNQRHGIIMRRSREGFRGASAPEIHLLTPCQLYM